MHKQLTNNKQHLEHINNLGHHIPNIMVTMPMKLWKHREEGLKHVFRHVPTYVV